jgi:ribose transport system substrate-binding protein
MKKRRLLTAVISGICLLMLVSLAACGGGGTEGSSGEGTAVTASSESASDEKAWRIGYDNMGIDWVLMNFQAESERVVMFENSGNKFEPIAADYSTDKMQSGIQSLISSGIDGLVYYAIYSTLTPTVQELCEQSETPFTFFHIPPIKEQYEQLQSSEMFAGYIGSSCYQIGYQLGEKAVADGGKVAIIIAGPVGTMDMDEKQAGFTAAFEKGGGKVVADAHCNFPTEAVEKSSDMLAAHPDVDTAYAATGVFGVGMISALSNHNRSDVAVYCSDLDSDLLVDLREGRIKAGDGGNVTETILATTLLLNQLDGKRIVGDDGKPVITEDVPTLIVTAENADRFEQMFITEHPFSEEMLKKLLYKYNPDVSWADYQEYIDNYSIDWIEEQRK